MTTSQWPQGTLPIWRSARNTYVVPSLGLAGSYHDSETSMQLRIWDVISPHLLYRLCPVPSLCPPGLLVVLQDWGRHAPCWPTQECGPIMPRHIIPSVHICRSQQWTCHLPAARVAIAQTAAQCSTILRGRNYIVLQL